MGDIFGSLCVIFKKKLAFKNCKISEFKTMSRKMYSIRNNRAVLFQYSKRNFFVAPSENVTLMLMRLMW